MRNKFNITNPITADVIEGKNKIDASSSECVGIIKDFYETVNMKNLHIKERLSTKSGKEFERKYTDFFSDVTSCQKENHYNIIVMSKTQGLKTKYMAYGIKSKHKRTAKQALNKMFKTYLEILSFSS